ELRTDPRGIDILRVNRVGTLEAPAWNSLLDIQEIVIRHVDGASQDLRVPVAARLDGKRIRLDPLDPAWKDFRKIAQDDKLSGPFAVLPNVPLEVEVHGSSRLPLAAETRRSLVPIHDDPRPRGPQERELYEPHPAELIAAGFSPPYRPAADVRVLIRRVQEQRPGWGGQVFGIAALLLAASTTLGWALLVREPARRLLGQGGSVLVPLAVCALPMLGGLLASSVVDSLALAAYAFATVPVLGVLVLNLAKVRDSSRN
ncbi:MAG: hypothetical protein KUG77_21520, partial [Nannocystaceae bacterium]|nr:hypothetical protein [Nannocystaceae bacterium]